MWMLCDSSCRLLSLAITRSTLCPCSSCSCWKFWRCWLASPWRRCRWTAPSCWCSCGSHPRGTSPRPCSGICTWRRAGWGCRAPPPLRYRPPFPSCCWTRGRLPTCPGNPLDRPPWDWLEERQKWNKKKKKVLIKPFINGRNVFIFECLVPRCMSYPIKEHSFKHVWDKNIQYKEVNGISSQSLSEKKRKENPN